MPARNTILTLFAALSIASCVGGSTGPRDDEKSLVDGDVLIQTDRPVYTAERVTTYLEDGTIWGRYIRINIPLRYSNPTGSPLYLPTCIGVNPPILEKKEGARWVVAYGPVIPACLGPPVIIEPGEWFDYAYDVEGYLPGSNVVPEFETAVPGTYRLVWTAYETWQPDGGEPGLGRELPFAKRVSNEFEVVEAAQRP